MAVKNLRSSPRFGNDGQTPKATWIRGSVSDRSEMVCGHGARLVLATGRYLGEGFDDPRLDTLFLTMPISWKGTLAQYVGRLHREHQDKSEVVVHDYIDAAVPVLTRMAAKRQAGYRSLGYVVEAPGRDHLAAIPASAA